MKFKILIAFILINVLGRSQSESDFFVLSQEDGVGRNWIIPTKLFDEYKDHFKLSCDTFNCKLSCFFNNLPVDSLHRKNVYVDSLDIILAQAIEVQNFTKHIKVPVELGRYVLDSLNRNQSYYVIETANWEKYPYSAYLRLRRPNNSSYFECSDDFVNKVNDSIEGVVMFCRPVNEAIFYFIRGFDFDKIKKLGVEFNEPYIRERGLHLLIYK